MAVILIKRIYLPAETSDGARILVDRLWPRGVSKAAAKLDLWLKEIAPSTELRQWFHNSDHTDRWEQFKAKYLLELAQNRSVAELKDIVGHNDKVTLLYSVNDGHHNHALILKEFIGE